MHAASIQLQYSFSIFTFRRTDKSSIALNCYSKLEIFTLYLNIFEGVFKWMLWMRTNTGCFCIFFQEIWPSQIPSSSPNKRIIVILCPVYSLKASLCPFTTGAGPAPVSMINIYLELATVDRRKGKHNLLNGILTWFYVEYWIRSRGFVIIWSFSFGNYCNLIELGSKSEQIAQIFSIYSLWLIRVWSGMYRWQSKLLSVPSAESPSGDMSQLPRICRHTGQVTRGRDTDDSSFVVTLNKS